MFFIYILYSPKFDKIYTGFTSNLEGRLLSHNELAQKGWTKNFRPWLLAYSEAFEFKQEAMKREKFLKSGIGREFVQNLIFHYKKTI
jgi:putative endonuclease